MRLIASPLLDTDDFVAIEQRSDGLTRIRILPMGGDDHSEVKFSEDCYVASVNATPEASTPWLRYSYSSMTTPAQVFDYDVETRERALRKQQEEYEQDAAKLSDEEYAEDDYENLASVMKRFLGRLTAGQETTLRDAAYQLQRFDLAWLENGLGQIGDGAKPHV